MRVICWALVHTTLVHSAFIHVRRLKELSTESVQALMDLFQPREGMPTTPMQKSSFLGEPLVTSSLAPEPAQTSLSPRPAQTRPSVLGDWAGANALLVAPSLSKTRAQSVVACVNPVEKDHTAVTLALANARVVVGLRTLISCPDLCKFCSIPLKKRLRSLFPPDKVCCSQETNKFCSFCVHFRRAVLEAYEPVVREVVLQPGDAAARSLPALPRRVVAARSRHQ